jgi:hypothetical protein
MTEVAQRLPHGQEHMRYMMGVRDCASITECAVTDDGGKLSPLNSGRATVHHCPAWRQGEFFRPFQVHAPRSAIRISKMRGHMNLAYPQPSSGGTDPALQAIISQAVREALETAARRLLADACNTTYQKAMRRAVRIVRDLKPD